MWLAVTGLCCRLPFFTTSGGLWAYGYQTEVPQGFRRLNFMSDISAKGFVVAKGKTDIFNPDVKALDGQKVFIKGYMYPTKQMQGLTTFLLVKDNAQCCFGGNPAMQDMILVNMVPREDRRFSPGLLTSVAGVFHCQQASGPAGLQPTYTIDGNRSSKTPVRCSRLARPTTACESSPSRPCHRNRRWTRSENPPG